MGKVRVGSFGVSIDGYGAGPRQDLEHPLGVGGERLFEWFFATHTWCAMHGKDGGETGVDDEFAKRGFENVGAWILGRNMFGPVRGAWPDEAWNGWWGDEPPFHVPVFVLTHHRREPLAMRGGTTFHFVTEGIEGALARAREAAGRRDVRIGGGVATIREYLRAGLIDEMHLAVVPALLGAGEQLFAGIDLPELGYAVEATTAARRATHVVVAKVR
ncbi:MAG: dihydrofolate reductase family protein [Candidatus Cybelea sp.]